ncbi:MAG TPA: hypothetical protein PKE55_08210 [Kiritimatiellia bacterium]|nr:hypothetical protein [Kiritimatiellia bacterium]
MVDKLFCAQVVKRSNTRKRHAKHPFDMTGPKMVRDFFRIFLDSAFMRFVPAETHRKSHVDQSHCKRPNPHVNRHLGVTLTHEALKTTLGVELREG